jgi:protein TonB
MVEKHHYSLLGGIFSLSLYIAFISFFILLTKDIQKNIQSFSSKKKELFLEVNLVNLPKVDETQKAVDKSEKKPTPKPPEQEKKEEIKSDIPQKETTAKDLKSLFDDIDTSKYKRAKKKKIKKKVVQDPFKELTEEKIASRLKMKKNSSEKKADKLLKKFISSKRTINVSYKRGIFDKFYGRVQEILDSNWQLTYATESGSEGRVRISVDADGNMRYEILSLSYSKEFNDKLREFLEQMKLVEFPRYLGNGVAEMDVNFKDE